MSSGQMERYLALDNLRDQIVLEWVKVFSILLGIGLAPLLVNMAKMPAWLEWSKRQFWLFGLVVGLLTILTGVIYGLRQAASIRRRLAEANPPLVLEEAKRPPRDIHVQTQIDPLAPYPIRPEIDLLLDYLRLARAYARPLTISSLGWLQHALAQPEMKLPSEVLPVIWSLGILGLEREERPTLAHFLNEIPQDVQGQLDNEGLNRLAVLREILGNLSGKLQDAGSQAGEALTWLRKRLNYSDVLKKTYAPDKISREKIESVESFIKQIEAKKISAQTLAQWPDGEVAADAKERHTPGKQLPDRRDETDYSSFQAPTFLIAIGIFILLPALVSLLVQRGKPENPDLIQWYFSSPAIFLWVGAEAVYFYQSWHRVPEENRQRIGVLKSVLQIAGALALWTYLGSYFGLKGISWLFWLAAGLAAAGALLGSLRLRRQPQGKTDKGSTTVESSPDSESAGATVVGGPQAAVIPAGRFQVFRGKDGQYYFRLRDEQGEIILASEGYTTRTNSLNGILSVKKNAALSECFQRRAAANGGSYFVLKAGNQQVIGTSQTFSSQDDLENDLRNVQELAPRADIEDLT